VNLTLFIFDDILKNEMRHPVYDETLIYLILFICWENGPTHLYRCCCFMRKRTNCLGYTLRRTGVLIPLLGHEGSSGGPSTLRLEQPH